MLIPPPGPLRRAVVLTALVMIVLCGPPTGAQEQVRRLLILHPDSNINQAALIVGQTVQHRLSEHPSIMVTTHAEFLERARFPGEAHSERFIRYLGEKYAAARPDAILAIGTGSLNLILTNRDVIAPSIPIVFCCASPARLSSIKLPPDVTGIMGEFDISKTVSLARALQPNARNLVVVTGAAPFDREWAKIAQKQLIEHEKQLTSRYLVGLTHRDLLTEVKKLSPDTIVVLLSLFRDGSGREFRPALVQEIAAASNAPVYGPYDTDLGRGIVGGHMDTFEAIGIQTADALRRILDGENPSAIAPRMSETQTFRVDARQLKRWNLSAQDLPPDTIVMFKEPTLWQGHRDAVVATTAAFFALTTILGLLLFQIIKRRKAESHLRDSEERLEFSAASADVGLWQYEIPTKRLWTSEHCKTMFGLAAHEPLTAEALLDKVHMDDRHVAKASIRAATFGTLSNEVSEFRVTQADGGTRWLQARGRTDLDERKVPLRVSGIFRDITSAKVAQLEAKQLSQRVLSIQDEERQRIAQELHDSTAQHIAAVSLNLVALKGSQGFSRKTSSIFDDIDSLLQEAARELRTFTYLLHPPALANDGLTATLRRYIEGFTRRTNLSITLRSAAREDLSPQLQESILRIVQEALANVHRHASASRATVRLRQVANRLHLVIKDDGRGLPARSQEHGEPLPTGLGIAGMTARVRYFGGKLHIRSRPTGTTVHAALPMANGSQATALRPLPLNKPAAVLVRATGDKGAQERSPGFY